jgi:hypothetical protein
MIARIFAETGVKDLFKKMLKLTVECPVKQRVVRLRGEWVEMDPSTWNTEMDCEIEVGLGVGQAAERIAFLMQMLQVQQQGALAGLNNVVTPDNFYRAGVKMVESMGIPNPELYFTDPRGKPPPPPQPDGKDQVKIMETKRRSQDNSKQLQLDASKLRVDVATNKAMAEFRVLELDRKMDLEREKLKSNERIALAQINANKEVAESREETIRESGSDEGGSDE